MATDTKFDDELSSIKPLFQRLTGAENYRYWEGQMRSTLNIYRVWEVVSGEITKPPIPDLGPDLIKDEFLEAGGNPDDWTRYNAAIARYQRWMKMDTKAMILIRTHLNETHAAKVQGQTTSKGMWDHLANDLQTNTMAPLLHIHDKIRSAKIEEFKSPTEYVSKMESFFEEQGRLGFNIDDYVKILHLIDGLSHRYRELVDRFKNYTRDQWSLAAVKNAIVSFTIPMAKPPPLAANTTTLSGSSSKKRKQSQNVSGKQSKHDCAHCKMKNHKSDDCWFKHPEKRPAKRPKVLDKTVEDTYTVTKLSGQKKQR